MPKIAMPIQAEFEGKISRWSRIYIPSIGQEKLKIAGFKPGDIVKVVLIKDDTVVRE